MIEDAGVEVVHYALIGRGEKMFFPIFEALAAKDPDYIYFVSAASDAVTFTKQWTQSAAKDIDLYDNAVQCSSPSFWDRTGGAALGSIGMNFGAEAPLSEKTIPFIKNLKAAYGKDPNTVSYGSYDVPYLIKAAAEKASTTKDIEVLIETLESIETVSLWGLGAFQDAHNYQWGAPYMDIARVQFQKDGELVVLYPYEVAKAANPDKTFIPVKELRKN